MTSGPGASDLGALNCLDDSVRGSLYAFVAESAEPVGRDAAAASVGISRALAAYHLDKLVESGLLTASFRRPPGRGGPGAGRPAKVYTRSGREFTVTVPAREYELAARLLARAVESDPGGRCRATLRSSAYQVGMELGRRRGAGRASGGDVTLVLADELREHGFEPWRDADGIGRLRNCPFRELAVRHPAIVCDMNLALIEGLVAGLEAGRLRPTLDPRPGMCCVAIGVDSPDTC